MKQVTQSTDRFTQKLAQRAQKRANLRVLAVDDEPGILELLRTAFVALDNYDISVASSAPAAIKTLENADKPFDCLLIDIQMPGMNGIELLREVRTMPDYTETPVIMLTAMSDRKYVDEAFLEGATDYVGKPFELMDLRGRMHAAYRLVQERQRTQQSLQSAKLLQDELDYAQQFSFDDPLSIEGVERVLRYMEFDNYIGQLSRGRLFNSQAIAVKLQDAEYCYDLSSCSEFRQVVHDIAYGIDKAARDIDCVFSYRGSGIFLVAMHKRSGTDTFPSEKRLNEIVGTLLGQRRASRWGHVLVGEPVSMRSLSRSGAMNALSKAEDNVNALEVSLQQDLDSEASKVGEYEHPEDKGIRRKVVYERVLMELFGEESYLAGK
ncbi:response regulator [Thalassovita aquimarina]|uniref:Response regulator n=1 Tax=Thalassovita aquimarina TaxID=2785917 RepID=A0ABS5HX97_9RHOB|nr:response regulator [Thalassovita aquimarina]MBR9653559.1 response regulator [Thalassovita aquimarina]